MTTAQYLDFVAETGLFHAMREAKRLGTPEAKAWLKPYAEYEQKYQAYLQEQKHHESRKNGPDIWFAEGSCSINSMLKDRIKRVAHFYFPCGALSVGHVAVGEGNATRYCTFQPIGKRPVLLICTRLNSIVDVGSYYPEDKGNNAYKALKAEIIRQHNAGVYKYWD